MKSKRQAAREKRKQKRQFSTLIWVVVGVSVVVLFVYIGTSSTRTGSGPGESTQIGQSVPVEEDLGHVPEGQDPGPFNTDPPTSGRHYAGEFEAGFYEQTEKNFKVIAFPWKSLDVPVVMTSWGRLERFETFDPVLAGAFVVQNRNKAPEPQAP